MLGSFLFVAGLIVVQQAREVLADNAYQAQRAAVVAEQQRASDLGLQPAEFSDLERQEQTTASQTPPQAAPPFNEARISFFNRQAGDEAQIKSQLESRITNLLDQTRGTAQKDVTTLATQLQKAQQVGVDPQLLVSFDGLPSEAQIELDDATTVGAYRSISTQLTAPLSKLSLLISDQQQTNQLIAQYSAQIAQQDHGDINLARSNAQNALKRIQGDLQTASIFRMDVSIVSSQVQALSAKLSSAGTLSQVEQADGGLMVQDKVLQDAMSQNLPVKAITISLSQQVLRAYDHGKQVWWTYVTTGRPGLETDPGYFKVYWKVSPWTMHSPWPKGSVYWYPDTKVQMVMWFNGGAGIHDSSWRAYYGPGTEFPHYDPFGDDNGSHGCVNVPPSNMPWLWNWTPTGTPVIVYQ